MSLELAPFNSCSFLALHVCVVLAVFASAVPRLQYSQDMRSPLADEHALIASYVARLQHCARSVEEEPQQWAARQGLSRGRETVLPGVASWKKLCTWGIFLRSYQLCLAEFR